MSAIINCVSCIIRWITYPVIKLIDIYERNIFTEKYTIKFQLILSFLLTTSISIGLTLCLLFGLLYGTGSFTIQTAYKTIILHTKSNAYNVGREIAGAIEQEIKIVAEGICMSNALYAKNLLKNRDILFQDSTVGGDGSGKVKIYPEFCFLNASSYSGNNCTQQPRSYGPFSPSATRLPISIPDFSYGTLDHTSIYVMDSSNTAPYLRVNGSYWATRVTGDFKKVIDALGYQDQDMKILYEKGPSSTVFFYLSAKYGTSSYKSAHRTYPGLLKNVVNYDPPNRTWFRKAPEDAFYVSAYKETFSLQLVITISSRKIVSASDSGLGLETTVVAGASILLSTVGSILKDVTYENDGFGVLLSYKDLKVLSWLDKDTYDETCNAPDGCFVDLSSIDKHLADLKLKAGGKFEYTDPDGVGWIVTSIPFLQITDYETSSTTYAFIILVFSKRSIALSTMTGLRSKVTYTESKSTIKTLIILAIVTVVILHIIFFTVFYIVNPIDNIRRISKVLIKIAGDDEENRDYTDVINDSFFSKFRPDEVGHTAFEYYRVICVLNNRIVQKRSLPKCPKNPFYIKDKINYRTFDWDKFYTMMKPKRLKSKVAENAVIAAEAIDMTDNLDVLSQIAAAKNKKNEKNKQDNKRSFIKVNLEEEDDDGGDIEIGQIRLSEDLSVLPADKFKTNRFASIALKFNILCYLLVAALIVVSVLTLIDLSMDGSKWMTTTSKEMETKQMQNLATITIAKGIFVKYFMQKVFVTMECARQYANFVFDDKNTRLSSRTSNTFTTSYLPTHKYALDSSFPDKYSLDTSNDFSGYYINTGHATSFLKTDDVPLTQSSLLDLKYSSFLYTGTFASFVQLGLSDYVQSKTGGFFRNLPYKKESTYENPTKCTVEELLDNVCSSAYYSSKCNYASTEYNKYDPRCRTWYQIGKNNLAAPSTYFGYPRISSSGSFVITAVAPIYKSVTTFDLTTFVGVININVLMSTLTESINALKILSDGYAYIIDTTNPEYLIMHPKASGSCLQVQCAEGLSGDEYNSFKQNVLIPINMGQTPSSSYTKKGKPWRLAFYSFTYETVSYTLIATVSRDSILEASNDVKKAISNSVITLIIIAAFGLLFVAVGALKLTKKMINAIVDPVQDLRYICTKLANNDYSCTIPTDPSSIDMKYLLDAFSHLLVALKFGSDTYARGNVNLAKDVFTDALQLFETTENGKGASACHNNLGVVETSLKNYIVAENHYQQSINFMIKFLNQGNHTSDDYDRAQRTLSDRKGNLALLYLEKGEFKKCFDLFEELLESDKKNGYIRGCVIKQGNLGQYYLKQGELKSAERYFNSALNFARKHDANLYDGVSWNEQEASVSEQIALFNIAKMHAATSDSKGSIVAEKKVTTKKSKDHKDIESEPSLAQEESLRISKDEEERHKEEEYMSLEGSFLQALTSTPYMHLATTKNVLDSLLNIYSTNKNVQKVEEITQFALHYKFDLKATEASIPKRVAFVIDYSGSMSGTKIKAAVQSMLMIFDEHISDDDEVMLVQFTHKVTVVFPLNGKGADKDNMRKNISNMTSPNGSTAFRDAVNFAFDAFKRRSGSNDWVISLTDGDDNSSTITPDSLKQEIQKSSAGLVVIGVGTDVDENQLKQFTFKDTGFYIKAGSNFDSISAAFGKVANIIQGQLVLEDV